MQPAKTSDPIFISPKRQDSRGAGKNEPRVMPHSCPPLRLVPPKAPVRRPRPPPPKGPPPIELPPSPPVSNQDIEIMNAQKHTPLSRSLNEYTWVGLPFSAPSNTTFLQQQQASFTPSLAPHTEGSEDEADEPEAKQQSHSYSESSTIFSLLKEASLRSSMGALSISKPPPSSSDAVARSKPKPVPGGRGQRNSVSQEGDDLQFTFSFDPHEDNELNQGDPKYKDYFKD